MRRVVACTTLALGVTAIGSAFAGGVPAYDPCPQLDKQVNRVKGFMKENGVKFAVAPNQLSDRVKLNGMVNLDGQYFTDAGFRGRTINFISANDGNIFVNNANLMTEVNVNKYTDVNFDIAYLRDSIVFENAAGAAAGQRDSGSAYSGDADLTADEVYVTFHHFTWCYPLVVRAGMFYNSFGSYKNPYPLVYSPVQLLTQQRTTTVEAAYTLYGFYGVVWANDGPFSSFDGASQGEDRLQNWGGKLAYYDNLYGVDYALAASYTSDVRDATFFDDTGPLRGNGASSGLHRADAWSAHAGLQYGPFGLNGNYVSTLESVSQRAASSARLWAADVRGDYNFVVLNHPSQLGAEYQVSGHFNIYNAWAAQSGPGALTAGGAEVPKYRWLVDYTVWLNKPAASAAYNTSLKLLWAHDSDYDGPQDNGSANRFAARVSVQL